MEPTPRMFPPSYHMDGKTRAASVEVVRDQPFARVTYEPTSPEVGSTPQVHWLLTDHLNSVRLVLDEGVRYSTRSPTTPLATSWPS
jgi:hypothetical protein